MDHKNLLRRAYVWAQISSKDKSTWCGALLIDPLTELVVSEGANLFTCPSMVDDPKNHERPRKYQVTEHAERLAIYKAAENGVATKGLVMVAPWAACPDCARAIVHAGILLVIAHKQAYDKTPDRWKEEVDLGIEILERCGVIYHLYGGKIGDCSNLFNGKRWLP